jgi:[ribosomal protein S5]-alanine N-acetyltransferase
MARRAAMGLDLDRKRRFMSQICGLYLVRPRKMPFSLLQVSNAELEALAASQVPVTLASRIEPDALPPPFVAGRALELAAAGHSLPWSTTFLIVNDENSRIVGGCGFKTAIEHGRVEVGYGVALSAQGKGAATTAVNLLVRMAFAAGATEVLAEVAPDNQASTRVVQKAGFKNIGSILDRDNEHVVRWLRQSEA